MSSYCAQSNIETVYGTDNVADWAAIDSNTSSPTRIAYAISVCSEELDDVARCVGYAIPLQTEAGATPTSVQHWTAVAAGLWLYESRGAQDYDQAGLPRHGHAWRRVWKDNFLERLRDGKIRLDAVMGST